MDLHLAGESFLRLGSRLRVYRSRLGLQCSFAIIGLCYLFSVPKFEFAHIVSFLDAYQLGLLFHTCWFAVWKIMEVGWLPVSLGWSYMPCSDYLPNFVGPAASFENMLLSNYLRLPSLKYRNVYRRYKVHCTQLQFNLKHGENRFMISCKLSDVVEFAHFSNFATHYAVANADIHFTFGAGLVRVGGRTMKVAFPHGLNEERPFVQAIYRPNESVYSYFKVSKQSVSFSPRCVVPRLMAMPDSLNITKNSYSFKLRPSYYQCGSDFVFHAIPFHVYQPGSTYVFNAMRSVSSADTMYFAYCEAIAYESSYSVTIELDLVLCVRASVSGNYFFV